MNTKSKLFTVVLEEYDKANNQHVLIRKVVDYLQKEDYITYYAVILHDQDYNDDGELERKHFHLVLETRTLYSKSTILTDMAKELLVDRSCISVRAYDNIKLAVQYLIHKNDVDKFQYDIMGVISSDETRTIDLIEEGINSAELQIDDLITICEECDNLTEIYKKIGLVNARKYRWVINDLRSKIENEEIVRLRNRVHNLQAELRRKDGYE